MPIPQVRDLLFFPCLLNFTVFTEPSNPPSTLGPSPSRPSVKVYNSFGLRAASLLVFQHIFKGAIGEAFLGLMTASQKYQASNKEIVGAYTRLYQLLLVAGYDNWQDYVLDQVGTNYSPIRVPLGSFV
jgi:hypothetical protein